MKLPKCDAMNERFRVVQGILVIIERDGKVLMLRRKNKFDAGTFSIPGGCMEDSETVKEAAIRETKEEVNINLSTQNIEIVSVFHRMCSDGWQSVEFVAAAKNFEGEPKLMELDKSDRLEWFDVNNLPENISKYAKKAIENYINKESFSEIDY